MVEIAGSGNPGGNGGADDLDNLIIGTDSSDTSGRGGSSGGSEPAGSIDPSGAINGSTAGKRRGRKPGGKNRPKVSAAVDLGAFAGIVGGIHAMLAGVAKIPELELDAEESDKVAKASYNVMRHYVKLDVTEKGADWVNLFMALGAVYGPRFVALKMRRQKERGARVVPMRPVPVDAVATAMRNPAPPPQPAPKAPGPVTALYPDDMQIGAAYNFSGGAPPIG